MPTTVLAPVAGAMIAIDVVDDEVFSSRMMGDGAAIRPAVESGADETQDADAGQVIVAPVTGRVTKARDHAVMIEVESGETILVHLGIDTHGLGEHFALTVSVGDRVEAGEQVGSWDPGAIATDAKSNDVIVVAMRVPAVDHFAAPDEELVAGDALFNF